MKNHNKTSKYRVVLLTDTKSILQALTSAKCPPTEQLRAAICQLHSTALTVAQWIRGHSNIPGNDQSDSLAKEVAKLAQIENDLDLPEIKQPPKALIGRQDQYHLLTRPEQVTIFRLRTGHNRLRQNMHSKFKAENTPDCRFCKQATETTAHILQQCPSLSTLRCDIWDQPTSLDKRLAGSLNRMKRTFQFIERAGVSV